MRRLFVAVLTVLLALPLGLATVAAQDATPIAGASPASGGPYPEVAVTITKDAIQVASGQIPSGYVRLSVTNSSDDENGIGLVAVPAGESLDTLGQATPEPNNFLPPFLYTATVAGGPTSIPTGETWTQIVHLDPGQWIIFPQNDQRPVEVTAAETADSVSEAPTADATITETDFAFAGFEQLAAGPQTVAVTNQGAQPHMLDFFQVPDGTTMDQVEAALSTPDGATPAPGGLQESDIKLVANGQVLLQSSGTTVWMDVDLQAGTYVAACFVIDPETGQPHAMEGMVDLFQVGGAGMATPAG